MAALLPVLTFAAMMAALRRSRLGLGWSGSFLGGALIWGVLVALFTEVPSLFGAIRFGTMLALWLASALGAVAWLVTVTRAGKVALRRTPRARLGRSELVLPAGMALIVAAVGVTAAIAPPNTWDAMTYHMSRVAHWIQDRSVAAYPTSILRQLHAGPWAGFAIMQLQVLALGDRFSNLVQWFALVGCAVGAGVIARRFGAEPRGQVFSAAVTVAIPMGVLQGSSAQTDVVVAFWIVCFAACVLRMDHDDGLPVAVAAGASLGLALLTKATAYLYAAPFVAWTIASRIGSRRRTRWRNVGVVVALASAINAGQWTRNVAVYRNPLGPSAENGSSFPYANAAFGPATVASNAVRNLALHAGTVHRVDAVVERVIARSLRTVGIDPDDPRTTWTGTTFHVEPLSLHEDSAGNLLHLVLIVLTLPLVVALARGNRAALRYLICLAGGALLFVTVLRWQPWHSRLHLPLFVLWAPLVGTALSRLRFRRVASAAVALVVAGALPWALRNRSRPLLGPESIVGASRTDLYFRNRPRIEEPYLAVARFVQERPCAHVGLLLGVEDWEYPFWVLLNPSGTGAIRLRHVAVDNVSRNLAPEADRGTPAPCAVISTSDPQRTERRIEGASFSRAGLFGPVAVLVPETEPTVGTARR